MRPVLAMLAFISIAVVAYSYAYFRASYLLAGREILPVIDDNGRIIANNIRDARFVATWHGHLGSDRPLLWRAHGGELHGR